jgi:hypothetical protein
MPGLQTEKSVVTETHQVLCTGPIMRVTADFPPSAAAVNGSLRIGVIGADSYVPIPDLIIRAKRPSPFSSVMMIRF